MGKAQFILASKSSQRLGLLKQIHITPDLAVSPNVDESQKQHERPDKFVSRLALEKATAVFKQYKGNIILAADTAVCCGTRVLEKTGDKKVAQNWLKLLSGRRHRVITGLCILDAKGKKHIRKVVTYVRFKRLTPQEIDTYIKTNEWIDRAGGYGIQGCASSFVISIFGSYSNVVGLPLYDVAQLLNGLGFLARKN